MLGILFGLFVIGAQPVAAGLLQVPWDKLAHAGVFALLAVAIALSFGGWGWRMSALGLLGALLVGLLDEWHQMFLPGRQAGWDDFAADASGALLGLLCMTAVHRTWLRRAAGNPP